MLGSKDISVLSMKEWMRLVNIYEGNEQFDPLTVVSRERVRKSLLNGIPA